MFNKQIAPLDHDLLQKSVTKLTGRDTIFLLSYLDKYFKQRNICLVVSYD